VEYQKLALDPAKQIFDILLFDFSQKNDEPHGASFVCSEKNCFTH